MLFYGADLGVKCCAVILHFQTLSGVLSSTFSVFAGRLVGLL